MTAALELPLSPGTERVHSHCDATVPVSTEDHSGFPCKASTWGMKSDPRPDNLDWNRSGDLEGKGFVSHYRSAEGLQNQYISVVSFI